MILWNLQKDGIEWDINIGAITIIRDTSSAGYQLIRLVEDYFNNKSTENVLTEDMQVIAKKDWECFFIPYDSHLIMDKLTAKSPLNPIMSKIIEQLSLSPAYMNISDAWSELIEEELFLNQFIAEYDLEVQIKNFEDNDLKSFLSIKGKNKWLMPIDYKIILLNLIASQTLSKKRLILIELPELFADEKQMKNLVREIERLSKIGYRFLIVSEHHLFQGTINFFLQDKIINEAVIESAKSKILSDIPFIIEEEDFNFSKKVILENVDNFYKSQENQLLLTSPLVKESTIVYTTLTALNLSVTIDTTGFPKNIIDYINGSTVNLL